MRFNCWTLTFYEDQTLSLDFARHFSVSGSEPNRDHRSRLCLGINNRSWKPGAETRTVTTRNWSIVYHSTTFHWSGCSVGTIFIRTNGRGAFHGTCFQPSVGTCWKSFTG